MNSYSLKSEEDNANGDDFINQLLKKLNTIQKFRVELKKEFSNLDENKVNLKSKRIFKRMSSNL